MAATNRNTLEPAANPSAMGEAMARATNAPVPKSSKLRIATGEVMAAKAIGIQGVETLLGVKSARMADAAALFTAFKIVTDKCDTEEIHAGTQRVHAICDLLASNTPEAIESATSLKPWKDEAFKAKNRDYQRTSDLRSFIRVYYGIGRHALEQATNGMPWSRGVMPWVRTELKRVAKAEHEQRILMESQNRVKIAHNIPIIGGEVPKELQKTVMEQARAVMEKEEADAQAKKDAKQTPEAQATAYIKRLFTSYTDDDGTLHRDELKHFVSLLSPELSKQLKAYDAAAATAAKLKADAAKE